MAYYDDNEEEQQDPNAPPPVQGSAPTGVIGSGDSPSSGQSTAGQGKGPDNFVGIQQYIDANKPQSAKLAQSVGNVVTQQGDAARTALDQGQNSFNADVDQGSVSFNPDLGTKVQTSAEKLSDDEKSEFKKERDAQYTGPSSFQETQYYAPAQQAAEKANQYAANTQTEAGQRELLKPIEQQAKHGTSAGIGTFDSALLQAAPNARTELEQARQNVSDIDPKMQQLIADALQNAAQTKSATQATSDAAKQAVLSGVGNLDVQNRYNNYLSGNETANQSTVALLSQLGSNPNAAERDATPPDLSQLFGIPGDTSLYGVNDLNKYVNQTTPASLGEYASPEDYARYAALQDLGGQFTFNLNPADASMAGTAGDKGKLVGDKARLLQDVAAAKGAYQTELNNTTVDQTGGGDTPMSLSQWLTILPKVLNTPTPDLGTAQKQALKALDKINEAREKRGLGKIMVGRNSAGGYSGQLSYGPDSTIGSVRSR